MTSMIFLTSLIVVVGFPAAAVWAWRSGGASSLYLVTGCGLAVYIAVSLFAASPMAGNRLVVSEGYWRLAPQILFYFGLMIGLPILAGALVVRGLGRRMTRPVLLYITAVCSAFLTFMAGTILVLYAFFS